MKAIVTTLWLASVPVLASIAPEQVQYLGHFSPPAKQADGPEWTGGANDMGLSIVPDCLGLSDPSPHDGYPGCALMYLKQTPDRLVGLIDLVPPGKGLQASPIRVWSLFGQYPEQKHSDWFRGGLDSPFDLLYDKGSKHCRIWWVFVFYYANGMKEGTPFLGYSSCDPDQPNPQGMWAYTRDFHPNKASRSLTIIPQSIADKYFGGQQFAITQGKGSGTRGSSGGPSIVVRDRDVPDRAIDDFKPVLWYRARGYPCWAEEQDFRIPITLPNGWYWEAPFTMCSRDSGGEFIDLDGEYAYIASIPMPIYDPTVYPYDRDDTIYHQGDPSMPDLRIDPATGRPRDELAVTWYGADREPHKLADIKRRVPKTNSRGKVCDPRQKMPGDSLIESDCSGGRGPHCNNYHLYLLLYDLDQLADNYRGKTDPWSVRPYGYLDITDDIGQKCSHRLGGTMYDPATRTYYLATSGQIHAWRIGKEVAPQPEKKPEQK